MTAARPDRRPGSPEPASTPARSCGPPACAASALGKQLGEQSGAAVDRAGRVEVRPDLTLPGHPEVYVIGDMASLNHYPGVSQVAMQRFGVRGRADQPAHPRARAEGAVHATSTRAAWPPSRGSARWPASGRSGSRGFIAWMLWLGVHIFYLVGFKNRVTTLLHWAISFIGNGRSQRSGAYPRPPTRERRAPGSAAPPPDPPGREQASLDQQAPRRAHPVPQLPADLLGAGAFGRAARRRADQGHPRPAERPARRGATSTSARSRWSSTSAMPTTCVLLPDIAVGSDGPVLSVNLVSQVPLATWTGAGWRWVRRRGRRCCWRGCGWPRCTASAPTTSSARRI